MTDIPSPGPADAPGFWIDHPDHLAFLATDARRAFHFFEASLGDGPGYHTLAHDGSQLASIRQELHTTTRLIHSYALGQIWGIDGADRIIDQGMAYLKSHHRDTTHGGYLWGIEDDAPVDTRKLAYGHVFVLLAGSSAKMAGHPDADALIADVTEVLDAHFWDDAAGLFRDEFNRDWTPFSTYRGMNANMHGVEALLTAFEATGEREFLTRAGRILDFFVGKMAPKNGWRLPEHYREDWTIDRGFKSDNPMFRPDGTTPGHSFELGRLALQWWDLAGRPDDGTPNRARCLIEQALSDAWFGDRGGIAYTLDFDGDIDIGSRYWWPVTEAIGAMATLIKLDQRAEDEAWYRRLWSFASAHFVDHARGGWFPELDDAGALAETQFVGKPDIYHALQADLFPTAPGVSWQAEGLTGKA